jgi:hypothetical protein
LQTFIPYNNLATFQSAGNPNLNGTGYQLAAVPGNLIDPVAAKMMTYFPLPNFNVGTSAYSRYTNWTGSGVSVSASDQGDVRIDHRFTEKTTLTARYSENYNTGNGGWNCYQNALDPCTVGPTISDAHAIALIFNHTFNPTMLLSVSLGLTRQYTFSGEGIALDYPNFDPVKTLGLPAYVTGASGVISSPNITLSSGYTNVDGADLGSQTFSVYRNPTNVWQLTPILTKMHGRHEIKVGAEWRENQMNWFQAGRTAGAYTFTFGATAQYPSTGGGDAMASFMTGLGMNGGSGQYDINAHFSTQNYRWGGFVQDNWRATKKLTVNVGVRYDLEIPRTERYNRQEWWDPTVVQSIHPAAINSATWPSALPYLPDVTHPVGGLVFTTPSQRHVEATYYGDVGPRLGLAYRLRDKLVLRTGYGLFYEPSRYGAAGGSQVSHEGFAASTGWVTTMGSDGVTPWGRLSDPWPGGPMPATQATLGAATSLGSAIREMQFNDNAPPYEQTWSGGFQYELPANWVVTANYVGTKGTHLYYVSDGNMQYLPTWVEQEATNSALVTALNTKVANPYYGVITTQGSSMIGPTISAGHLLEPFPEFNGVSRSGPPQANSIYNALQITVERRMAKGLAALISYTNSKSIDDSSASTYTVDSLFGEVRDPNNLKLERSLSEWDIPQVLQFAYVYQLPFGKGKTYGANWNSIVNAFLGGWQTNGIWRYDKGQPVHVTLSGGLCPFSYSCGLPEQTGPLKANPKSLWLTQGYFANGSSVLAVPPNYVVGNASREQPNVRAPGTNNATLSLFKQFSLNKMREGSRLEFRAEAFNALNHVVFSPPSATFNTGSFGSVTGQANKPREIQVALRLYF